MNCTFYDALGRDDDSYLLARALQFWAPGTPQIYYVGLLAGSNDTDLLARTNVGRDVNRHYYTPAEVDAAVARPVVQALFRLIRFRNTHPAFDGAFAVSGGGSTLTATWTAGADTATLEADLTAGTAMVRWSEDGTARSATLAHLP